MSLLVGELYAHLLLEKKEFSAALKEAQAESAVAGKSIGSNLAAAGKVVAVGLLAVGAVAAVVGVEGAKMAIEFEHAMELVQTQAGASAQEVHHLSEAILGMSASVGTGPEELAKGIYHIESAGIRGAKALDVLKTAALGAKVGNADLEAVTNALIAEVNSGIKGVNGMSEAMGVLNGIVGAGNMRMDDLASSMSTGILSVSKTFGVSIQSLGAALATMTDQGVPAVDAATKIKTAIISMAAPIGATTKAFASIGIGTEDLAKAMASPDGLVGALRMLKEHMEAAGLTSIQQGQLIANAFGKRGGPAVMTLINSLDMVAEKEKHITEATGGFDDAVTAMQKTVQFKLDQMGAAFDTIAIQIGNTLLPVIGSIADGFTTLLKSQELQGIFAGIAQAAGILANVLGIVAGAIADYVGFLNMIGMTGPMAIAIIGAMAVAFGVWAAGAIAAAAGTVIAFAPVIAVIGAVAAALFLLEKALEVFGLNLGDVFKALVNAVIGMAKGVVGTLLNLAGTVLGILASFPNPLQGWAKETQAELDKMRGEVDHWGVDMHGALEGIAADVMDILGVKVPKSATDGIGKVIDGVKNGLEGGQYAIKDGMLVMVDNSKKFMETTGKSELEGASALVAQSAGQVFYDEYGDEILTGVDDVGTKTLTMVETWGTSLKGVLGAVGSGAGAAAMSELAKGIASARQKPMDEFDTLKKMMKESLSPTKELMRNLGILMSKELAAGLKDKRPDVRAQAEAVMMTVLERIRAMHPTVKELGKKGMALLKEGMHSKNKEIKAEATEIYNSITHPISTIQNSTKAWGVNAMKNFIAGLESQQHHLEQVAQKLAGAVGSYMKISSPAEKGPMSLGGGPEGWGRRFGMLFAKGISDTVPALGPLLSTSLGAGGIMMPALASGSAAASRWQGGFGSAPGGELHNHYEVNVTGLVEAKDPFQIAKAMRRVSTITGSGYIGAASYDVTGSSGGIPAADGSSDGLRR